MSAFEAVLFDRAVERLGVEADTALYVGDSLEYDVAGARNTGLRAAWCPGTPDCDAGDYDPDYVLETLREVRDVLDAPPQSRS